MTSAASAIKAIADPRRREILRLVLKREVAAGEIAAHFEVSRPAISQHLTVLKSAGLVEERRLGTKRLYRASPRGLSELRAFLEGFWEGQLQSLKRAAEKEERRGDGRRKRAS